VHEEAWLLCYTTITCIYTLCIKFFVYVLANCPQGCKNHGTCILPGVCACTSGWTGSDCAKG